MSREREWGSPHSVPTFLGRPPGRQTGKGYNQFPGGSPTLNFRLPPLTYIPCLSGTFNVSGHGLPPDFRFGSGRNDVPSLVQKVISSSATHKSVDSRRTYGGETPRGGVVVGSVSLCHLFKFRVRDAGVNTTEGGKSGCQEETSR